MSQPSVGKIWYSSKCDSLVYKNKNFLLFNSHDFFKVRLRFHVCKIDYHNSLWMLCKLSVLIEFIIELELNLEAANHLAKTFRPQIKQSGLSPCLGHCAVSWLLDVTETRIQPA